MLLPPREGETAHPMGVGWLRRGLIGIVSDWLVNAGFDMQVHSTSLNLDIVTKAPACPGRCSYDEAGRRQV